MSEVLEAPVAEEVKLEDTVTVEEIEGTKAAVNVDLANELTKESPGGDFKRLSEREMMRNFTLTRNRQISDWLELNLSIADKKLRIIAQALRDKCRTLIAENTPEEFNDLTVVKKVLHGDAIELKWKNGGFEINQISLRFNETTKSVVIAKQKPVFAKSFNFSDPKLVAELLEEGIDLNLGLGRTDASILKSIVISIGQEVEVYNTKDATLVNFTSMPSMETSLSPLSVWQTMKPLGFNALLKEMQERKFVAISRKDFVEWKRDKSNDTPVSILDNNPYTKK